MKLEMGNGTIIQNPSPLQIEQQLAALGTDLESLAILSTGDMNYLQVAGSPDTELMLEYQTGSLDQHFRCTESALTLQQVIEAFQEYAAEDNGWLTLLRWERDESLSEPSAPSALEPDQDDWDRHDPLSSRAGCLGSLLLVVLVGLAATRF